ncbi:endonuclease/exonuclease/phosphatase family protein [Cellulomonas sp. PhB150]|uniref:endonuclease/exonuclease/phosphatase family protein n=1 Tax=Cellulomonas sp. PhB150 TaxID=2485188 RepID=UPI000F49C876|nr:endonuclease/exonuclease/phosphatase family protein [Cellulomonas sp. PhB150]ROS30515.1 endonuclease/exonuclease/phosphatase family metal-dependent hydrolase [Cellulomonas sp. PhB150]
MRVATYNIQHGRSESDRRVDVERFAAAVRDLDVDVLVLQEVDHHQRRSRRAVLTEVAADAMGGAEHRFVPTMRGVPGLWRAAGSVPAGRPAYGIAVLSRVPVLEWDVVHLAGRPGITWVGSGRVRRPVRDEPRAAVVAVVSTDAGPVTVVGTHLSWLPSWNGHQLDVLVEATSRWPRPTVLMGDLNMLPAQAAATSGFTALATGATYPVSTPVRQIDHVLGRGAVRAAGPATTVDTGLSDHRALVVDLAFGS